MYKKFIGFLTVLFLAFSINVVAGDTQYFLESTDENYPADGYMCSDSDYTGDAFLNAALNPETSVRMTPVFRKNCKPGYSRQPESEDENPLLATCKVTTWICNPGEYLDLTDKEHPRCKSCPAGYWCPVNSGVSNYTEYESLSISTNDSVYCTVNGVDYSAGGTVDDEENRIAAGKCACPTGTTTAASNSESYYGLNVQSIDGCMYHILEPGQQLKKNDVDGTYAVAPCDADHYCPGSMGGKYTFTASNASDSMKNCPYKENHIYPSLVTKEQCEGDNYGTGYKWENGRCVINSEDICNAKAIELGVDFKWVNGKCMLRGHSEPGSFRCNYDCPVGYSMHVMSNWNNQNSTCEPCPIGYYCPDSITYFMPTVGYSSKWENGECKNRITDTIITGITKDNCAEYMVNSDGQHIRDYKDANKYYGESVNNEPPKCPDNKTTKERGATSEDDCYATIYCAPGTYLVAGESECRPCDENANANNIWENGKCYRVTINGNHEEREEIKYVKFKPDCLGKNYCPGGYFLTNQMGESGYTGMYTCRPQAVTGDYGEPISAWDDIDGETINPTWTDAATFIKCSPYVNGCMASHNCIGDLAVCNNVIMSKKTHNEYSGADACSCPKGYEWNYETRACCDRYKVCCGPGFMPLTNTQTGAIVGCTQCNGEWADNSYCTGESVKIACSLPRDPSNLEVVIGYRHNSQCHTCVAGAVPGSQTEDNGYCNCLDAKMYEKVDNADTNTSTYLHLDLYPEAVDYHTSDNDHKPNNIRHWRIDLNRCVLKDFTAQIRYIGIAKDGSISYPYRQEFWRQRFAYGHKIDKVGNDDLYTQTESFDIPASALPAGGVYRGYNFTEEYEFKEEAELGNNGLKAEGADGYLFAGWCRDKSFCCPKGYKAKDVNGGKRVCEYCNGSVAYDEDYTKDCSGSAYTKATDVVTIDTKHKDNFKSIMYYAMMVTGRTCPSGTYLANVNDEECTICPAGYYCPGGAVSADNPGKFACDESGFNPKKGGKTKDACISCGTAVKQVLTQEFGGPSFKITGDNYADGLDYFGHWDDGLSNLTGVDENAWFKGVNINNVDFSKLVTTDKAQTSIKSCGYYCVAKKHAARGTYTCDEPCEANHYCPAGGRYPDYDGRYEPVYYRKHLLWYDPKEWMFDCPVGLVSDPNSAHCKISHCEAGYYARSTGRKWLSSADGYACRNINNLTVKYNEITNRNDCVEYACDVECSGHTGCDEEWDASISVCRAINNGHIIDGITTEADCTTVGGEWKLGVCKNKSDGSIIGDRVTKKSCEHTNCNTYFYCPESNNIDVMLEYYDESRHTPAWHDTGSTYNLRTCSGGQMAATAPASSCYAKPYAGSVQNRPSTYNVCNALDSSCPLEGNGWRKCPAGSVATGEASSINDCKCLSDIDLLDGQVPQYRPNGVYAEKGASLQYDPYSGETVCVNTYLVVNDSTIYEDVKATGVNEASVSDANARVVTCQWVSDDSVSTDLQQTTGKYKKCTDQALRVCKLNDWLGDIEPTTVTHESVFVNFAETLYGHDTDEVKMAKIYDVFENHMATVLDISDIAYGDCSGTGAMYNIKYDVTEANYTDGIDPNPHAYGSTSLPISLVNPTVNTGYVFDGWCKYNSSADALEGKDTCTVECSNDNAEKCKVNKQNELGDVVALGTESVGHKWFNAIWKPAEYTITLNATENTGSPNYTLFEEYGVRWFVGAEDTCQITEEQNFTCLPTKNDAVFTGYWSEISEGNQVISNTGNILVPTTYFTADTTIYAQFMPCEAPVSGITTEAPILTVTDNKCAWVAACKTGYTSNTMVSVNDTDVPGVSVVGEYGTATVNALTDCDIIPYTITYEGVSGDDISWPKNPLDETEELHNVELYYVTSSDINLVNPTKTGYDFDGWCKYNSDSVPESGQDECLVECSDEVTTGCKVAVQSTENDVVAIASGSTGNKTFYAVWKPTTYTVTYNGLEGATFEDGEENPDKYTIKSEDIALFNPIKTGYVFDGWCKYNSDSVPESGQDECLVECSDEVTTGCKVAVQNTENNVVAIASGSTGNWVFTAKWHSSDCPAGFPKGNVLDGCYATIHYVQNCGQLGEGEENPTRYDAETILPITLYNPTKAHYTFDGWCLNGEDDETCLANTVEVTVDSETGEETRTIKRVIPVGTTGNITFVAKCTPTTYTIVFNANGGSGEMVPMTVKYDEEVNLMTNMFTKSGYSFAGWCDKLVEGTNTCAEDAHKYIDGESVLNLVDVYDTDTITLYAIWTPNLYTVTFDSNTSDTFVSGTKLDMVCTYGMACDIKNDNEITINDYEFVGWMTQPDGTAAEYTDSVTFETELPENKITLYALWRPVCVAGKRLHIGDTSMCMYTNKRTSPSVAIMLGDDKYYVNMCKSSECDNTMNNETEQKLHIKYNEETYNVYDLTAQ